MKFNACLGGFGKFGFAAFAAIFFAPSRSLKKVGKIGVANFIFTKSFDEKIFCRAAEISRFFSDGAMDAHLFFFSLRATLFTNSILKFFFGLPEMRIAAE